MKNNLRNKAMRFETGKVKFAVAPGIGLLSKFPISTFILLILLAASCVKEKKHPVPQAEFKITKDLGNLVKPTDAAVISSIRTIQATQKSEWLTSEMKGVITYDTRRAINLPVRFGGRIEKLFIKYNFQAVRKGQKVLEIYSPELVTAQRELLYLLESDPGNKALIDGAKQRLLLLGITDQQVGQLVNTRKESYSFAVFSPADGYIAEETILNNATGISEKPAGASGMVGGMGAAASTINDTPNQVAPTETRIREGMYVSTGETIFRIINTSQVWAEFDVYQKDAGSVRLNDHMEISFDNNRHAAVKARVNFVQPFFKEGENFVRLRAELVNPKGEYEIGQLVSGRLNLKSGLSLWIPDTSVLDLGEQQVVFLKRRGIFRPRVIEPGRKSENWVEILHGVEPGDSIAYQAQYMVDSESFIKVVR
jgi:membrane fusion protein, copper/silver efflux system